jgi:formamidopyrimidine-DNA glycosylase
MPELPEVHTTTTELRKLILDKKIIDVWSNYKSSKYKGKQQIKDSQYFKKFKEEIVGLKIIETDRVGKNVLINLENNKTILIHMKMTGHLLYGKYSFDEKEKEWQAIEEGPLQDNFNGWIRFVLILDNKKHLALSDMRKFAKITLLDTDSLLESEDLKNIGPDPLFSSNFTFLKFKERLNKKSKNKIKTALMDQTLVAGIGNIYSDEALWLSKIHPERTVEKIKDKELKKLFASVKKVLKSGIDFNGDSMSDYRKPSGEKGLFQTRHNVYQRKKEKCKRKNCNGFIERIKVEGRSSHFCPKCQKIK